MSSARGTRSDVAMAPSRADSPFDLAQVIGLPPLRERRARYRVSDAVYEQLSEAIRNLQLPPGTPISEPGVAAWLGVSRSPVREAFTRLVDLGLVNVVPQVGSHIAPISLREVEEAVFIRTALETSAFQRAIRDEDRDTDEIQRLVTENQAAAERHDLEAYFDTDERLHENVFALAGLPRLWQVVRGTKLQLDRLRRLHLEAAIVNPEIGAEHQMIVDALRDGAESNGVRVLAQHATRILIDTQRLQVDNPTYFEA
ncbi:GntR family transcriptional regulator [Rathayibacter soli]|uniref:GntR family transcriptional regulator n=1 Tax=Rathayibacter soli TaxID=3144168 RepID=UPI0027E47ED6|nr:GntR family transcriptional regulator [Glaciibacter superstes]